MLTFLPEWLPVDNCRQTCSQLSANLLTTVGKPVDDCRQADI